jgi:hypothetical protein
MMAGIDLISQERARQIESEVSTSTFALLTTTWARSYLARLRARFSADHDDEHIDGELVLAAVCYASPVQLFVRNGAGSYWEFWDKRPINEDGEPREPTREERLRMLAKAGALIAAEIDRLERLP